MRKKSWFANLNICYSTIFPISKNCLHLENNWPRPPLFFQKKKIFIINCCKYYTSIHYKSTYTGNTIRPGGESDQIIVPIWISKRTLQQIENFPHRCYYFKWPIIKAPFLHTEKVCVDFFYSLSNLTITNISLMDQSLISILKIISHNLSCLYVISWYFLLNH